MLPKATLERYIQKCDEEILAGDSSAAKILQEEILATLGPDLDNLKHGLTNYHPHVLTTGNGQISNTVDFIGDIKTLRSRLQVELEKINDLEVAGYMNNTQESVRPHKLSISHSSKDNLYGGTC